MTASFLRFSELLSIQANFDGAVDLMILFFFTGHQFSNFLLQAIRDRFTDFSTLWKDPNICLYFRDLPRDRKDEERKVREKTEEDSQQKTEVEKGEQKEGVRR